MTTDPSKHWYACQPCGENKLSKMVKDMFGKIGIEGKMNHSLQAMGASKMFQAGVPEKIVQEHMLPFHKTFEYMSIPLQVNTWQYPIF